MTSKPNASSHWERVAAELRACREAQQRAWGDIDNATLGRYLADEVNHDERQEIESALDDLPELRKLTELVRDVLGQSEVSAPASIPYGPATLPFSAQSRHAAATPGLVSTGRSGPMTPPPTWKQRLLNPRLRQRSGLVAAAGLLLALGMALPRSGMVTRQSGQPEIDSRAVAFRGGAFAPASFLDGKERDDKERVDNPLDPSGEDQQLVRFDAELSALKAEGRGDKAVALVRGYTSNLTRKAMLYRDRGDLDRAEPPLSQACAICTKQLGPDAPETVRAVNSLAGILEVALNAPPDYAPMMVVPGYANPYANPVPPAQPLDRPNVMRSESSYEPRALAQRKSSDLHSASPAPGRAGPAPRKNALSKQAPAPADPRAALCDRLTKKSQRELKASFVPCLTRALRETTDSAKRQRFALALARLGPAARDSVPVLVYYCQKAKADSERTTMLFALGQIGPAARQAMPVLLDSLQSDNQAVRKCAAHAILQLGPAVHSSIEELAQKSANDSVIGDMMKQIRSPEWRSCIHDECECFTVEAIAQARHDIRNLAATYRVEVLVETAQGKVVALTSKVADQKRESAACSVHLCINKDTGDVQARVSDALRKQGLTDAALRQALGTHLRKRDYDASLRESVRFLAQFEEKQKAKNALDNVASPQSK